MILATAFCARASELTDSFECISAARVQKCIFDALPDGTYQPTACDFGYVY